MVPRIFPHKSTAWSHRVVTINRPQNKNTPRATARAAQPWRRLRSARARATKRFLRLIVTKSDGSVAWCLLRWSQTGGRLSEQPRATGLQCGPEAGKIDIQYRLSGIVSCEAVDRPILITRVRWSNGARIPWVVPWVLTGLEQPL